MAPTQAEIDRYYNNVAKLGLTIIALVTLALVIGGACGDDARRERVRQEHGCKVSP